MLVKKQMKYFDVPNMLCNEFLKIHIFQTPTKTRALCSKEVKSDSHINAAVVKDDFFSIFFTFSGKYSLRKLDRNKPLRKNRLN